MSDKHDPVNSPSHYVRNGIELADVIDAWDLSRWLAQAVQYIFRADLKGSRLEDLRKARVYIDREIALERTTPATEPGPLPCGVCEQSPCEAEENPDCTDSGEWDQPGDCSTVTSPTERGWQPLACDSCRKHYGI